MTRILSTALLALIITIPSASAVVAFQDPAIIAPKKAGAVAPRKPQRERWSWNGPEAQILPTGDLQWQPNPFQCVKGRPVRYIDFNSGDDTRDGASPDRAWKHHPWDPEATSASARYRGICTYVFKRGVVYRGSLSARDSGESGNPVRLTSDSAWGAGDAVICGSKRITGWKKGAGRADIPFPSLVWYTDVPFIPRNLWEVRDTAIERIPLARTPNWRVSNPEDVMSEWWSWSQPEWWTDKNVVASGDHKAWIGIDTVHLTRDSSYYRDAIVHTEYGIVMGTPFPTRVEGYDPRRKGIVFQGIWFNASEKIISRNRYYLEDKPQYLDTAGEFWFERSGDGGRLYLRLPGDRDPNTAVVEAGRHIDLIQAKSLNHVVISGLTFRFTNTHWDLALAGWGHPDVDNACIRVTESAVDLRVANNRFEHAAMAVQVHGSDSGRLDDIEIADNAIEFTDHGALSLRGRNFGVVRVLRNRLYMIGLRPFRQDHGHALQVDFPERMEIAGNMLDRCYGAGIFVFGGKASGDDREKPLSRNLIHNNRVTRALLAANDWGSIETWQGGPHYVYNNVSGDPGGYWNWAFAPAKPHSARLGMAYYLDGCYKAYHFNNIAWGENNDPSSPLCNHAAFYEATPTIENSLFNNTVYKFALGSNWSPAGGRHLFLGNVWDDLSAWVFLHGQLKEDSAQKVPANYPHHTMAYGSNVFHAVSGKMAVFQAGGRPYADLQSFNAALTSEKQMAADAGDMAAAPPLRDAAKHDFRPSAGSAAIDRGVKVFVPWALARTVGEWQFRRDNTDPADIADNHWYMTPYYTGREQYHAIPINDLHAVGITAGSFIDGPLEDWTAGALQLNGRDQYAVLTQERMSEPFVYESRGKKMTAGGKDLANPDIDTGNLLIEAFMRIDKGHTGGVLAAKMADAGYQLSVNAAGSATLTLRTGGSVAAIASAATINDGAWHHVLAEVDRTAKSAAIYVDGNPPDKAAIDLPAGSSLSNTGDFFVGRNAAGHYFSGAVDFLRICRGTLADAKTSIEELYDWEFDGPFLRDFTGAAVTGKRRDAGALEYR